LIACFLVLKFAQTVVNTATKCRERVYVCPVDGHQRSQCSKKFRTMVWRNSYSDSFGSNGKLYRDSLWSRQTSQDDSWDYDETGSGL